MKRPAIRLIGAGALGTILAQALRQAGYVMEGIYSRRSAAAERLAAQVEAHQAGTLADWEGGGAPVVFCCVPDDALARVARQLAQLPTSWEEGVVLHTSGALTAGVLAPLAERGAAVGSFHPLQTFTGISTPDVFQGCYVTLEGDAEAVKTGSRLARALGARSLVLNPKAKMRYHLAASMASNYLVTLMALVGEVLSDAGIERQQGSALVRPLVAGTWQNLQQQLPENVLTGPIARGDDETVAGHIEALQQYLPHLLPVYAALGAETVRVALRGGKIQAEAAQAVLDALHEAVEPRDPMF